MERLLIISDSLGLPRKSGYEEVLYEQTWPYLLKAHFEVVHLGIGGATLDFLVEKAHYYRNFYPTKIILQSGIVDCAPRTLTRREKALVENIPFAGRLFFPILKKYATFIRSKRNVTLTSEESFKESLMLLRNYFQGVPIYCLSILPPSLEYEHQLPGISHNISNYNKILLNEILQNYIDLSAMPSNGILSDFHHLSAIGNSYVVNKIKVKLGINADC